MPAGPSLLGIAAFGAVKYAGYTAAGAYLRSIMPEAKTSPWLVGGVRTAIGVTVGFGAVALAESLGLIRGGISFYVLLIPIRLGEWLILLALFYRKTGWQWRRSLFLAGFGTFWSCFLDIPAILAVFVIPGGMWIC